MNELTKRASHVPQPTRTDVTSLLFSRLTGFASSLQAIMSKYPILPKPNRNAKQTQPDTKK